MTKEILTWRVSMAVCCALLILPMWVSQWPPLVDVPQHAAQLAFALRWPDSGFDYERYFELNLLGSSVGSFAMMYLLAQLVPILAAIKITLSLGLLGIPFATWRLLTATGGNRWWVFSVFPIAYGYALAWGFIGFIVATPFGLLLILAAVRYRENPTLRRAAAMTALCGALFAAHTLVLAYAGLVALLVVLLGCRTQRDKLYGSLALAVIVPVVATWWVALHRWAPPTTANDAPLLLGYGSIRIWQLLAYIIGSQEVSIGTLLIVVLVFTVPFAVGATFTSERWRLAPLVSALLFYFLVPLNVLNTALVSPRFSVFIVPGLLMALDPTALERRRFRAAAVTTAILFLSRVSVGYHAFDVEARGVSGLIDLAEPNKRLLALIDNPRSAAVPWTPYLHAGCYYQVRYGGVADFSFAEFYPNWFRYRPGMDPPLPPDIEWLPQQFRWADHGGELYDYFLVRKTAGSRWSPFAGAPREPLLIGSRGEWSLYRQTRR